MGKETIDCLKYKKQTNPSKEKSGSIAFNSFSIISVFISFVFLTPYS